MQTQIGVTWMESNNGFHLDETVKVSLIFFQINKAKAEQSPFPSISLIWIQAVALYRRNNLTKSKL